MVRCMKAIVQAGYGAPEEVLKLREVDVPTPGDDEVLVRVMAASVHPDVWHVVTGRPAIMRPLMMGWPKPKHPVPGTDMAGVVEAVGRHVTEFRPGDEVFGESHGGLQWLNGGAYAEYVAAPCRALALKPAHVSFEEAASVPTSGIIALHNVEAGGAVQPGWQVLINGAAGGVGSTALQFAKARGAIVTGVDRSEKLDLMRSLGADHVIDYTKEDVLQQDMRYDLIVDVASTLPINGCQRLLTATGKYVLIGHDHFGATGSPLFGTLPRFFGYLRRARRDPHLPKFSSSLPDQAASMGALKELLRVGALTPVIDRAYPLDQVAAAMRRLQSGEAIGRIIVIP